MHDYVREYSTFRNYSKIKRKLNVSSKRLNILF